MIRFPEIEHVRSAFKHLSVAQNFSKLDLYAATGIPPHWIYAFISNRKGAGSPKYDYMSHVVKYCEAHGIVFAKDGWTSKEDGTDWHEKLGFLPPEPDEAADVEEADTLGDGEEVAPKVE